MGTCVRHGQGITGVVAETRLHGLLDRDAVRQDASDGLVLDGQTWTRAVRRSTRPGSGAIERDQLRKLVDQQMTITQMAAELGVSTATVRRRLARYELRTARTVRRESGASAKDAGVLTMTLRCRTHGETEFILEGRGYYRCKRCRADRVARRRRKAKETLVHEAGGCCAICGYSRYIGALEFHHVDPSQKRLEVNANGATISLDALRVEASKCVLLCSNCHAEVENGVTLLTSTVSSSREFAGPSGPKAP
jgi:5-methylcytosine-specific restriction endonuclease McrA